VIIPPSWYVIGALAAGWAVTLGVEEYRISTKETIIAEWEAKFNKEHGLRIQDRLDAEAASSKLSEDYRKREAALRQEHAGVIDAANQKNQTLEASLVRATASSRSLSNTVASLKAEARRAVANSSSPGSCEAPIATNDLLGRMLERLDDAAGGFAAYADKLRIANEACVSAYGRAEEALKAAAVAAASDAASAP